MQISVINNAKRNMIFGVINKLVAILCPFIVRTVIHKTLGEGYLGLNSLFSSVLSVLSLSELGFGTAVVFNMYKPVAENDIGKVNALLNFYKKIYRIVGIVVLIIGVLLLPFIPHLVSGNVPEGISIRWLYIIYLFNTVISYFMFAYLSSLIVVYQREDVNSRTNLFITLSLNACQIIVLYVCKNYYYFTLLMPVFTIINNLRIAYVVHKMFPQYHCRGKLDKDTIHDIQIRVSGAFVSKMCHTSRNSFDSICISMFFGLASTAIYNNYYYIMSAIISILSIISASLLGGVGNHLVTKSVDENYNELKKLDFVFMWIAGWCSVCLLCLFQPFMKIWMGNNLLLDSSSVILFCLYFYFLKTGDMRSMYSNANGLWWFHRYRSIVETVGNIILNCILGYFWGINGIIIATTVMLISCNFIWATSITFRQYFGMNKFKNYIIYHIKYFAWTLLVATFTYCLCSVCIIKNAWIELICKGVICIIVPNIFYILRYLHTGIFNETFNMIRHALKRK